MQHTYPSEAGPVRLQTMTDLSREEERIMLGSSVVVAILVTQSRCPSRVPRKVSVSLILLLAWFRKLCGDMQCAVLKKIVGLQIVSTTKQCEHQNSARKILKYVVS